MEEEDDLAYLARRLADWQKMVPAAIELLPDAAAVAYLKDWCLLVFGPGPHHPLPDGSGQRKRAADAPQGACAEDGAGAAHRRSGALHAGGDDGA